MGTVEQLRKVRDPAGDYLYPQAAIKGHQDALVLFCAEFLGRQDAYHVAMAGLKGTGVDVDGDKLAQMAAIYPSHWAWHVGDVYTFVDDQLSAGQQWDIVSADPYAGQFAPAADALPKFCALARHVVILGTSMQARPSDIPRGWAETEMLFRSSYLGGTFWAVYRHA